MLTEFRNVRDSWPDGRHQRTIPALDAPEDGGVNDALTGSTA